MMKKNLIILSFLTILLTSCNEIEIKKDNDKDINLKTKIEKTETKIKDIDDDKKSTKKIEENIVEPVVVESKKVEIEQEPKEIKNIKSKVLDATFYSQFPLSFSNAEKYEEPYANFCEEASILNAFYYFKGVKSSKEQYIKDLYKLKNIEDKLFGENGYKHTDTLHSLLTLVFFQNDEKYLEKFKQASTQEEKDLIIGNMITNIAKNNGIGGKIIFKPKKEDIEKAIINNNLVVVPLYGKGLNNNLFRNGGPIYHQILIKGFNNKNFITNEIGITKGDSFEYDKDIILNNIHEYLEGLYPTKFDKGEARILVLFKYNKNNLTFIDSSNKKETYENKIDFIKSIDGKTIGNIFEKDFLKLSSLEKNTTDYLEQQKLIKSKIDKIYNTIGIPNIIRNYGIEDVILDKNMNMNFILDFNY